MRTKTLVRVVSLAGLVLAALTAQAWAQSTDVAWPSPVRSNEVSAVIAARDLGDARLTDHYFAFTGTPGDVLITVDSRNMNGDIDVFTLAGLQPLLKFTVYAGSSSPITKSIYLRKQEDLVLRVEGRTPNDDAAVYRIHFGGSFAPITSGPLAEHDEATQQPSNIMASGKGGRRVSSVGARIEEPRTEVAAAPTPEPTPVEPAEPKAPTARPTARGNRSRRPPTRRTRPVERSKPDATVATGATEKPAEDATTETKPAPEDAKAEETKPSRTEKRAPGRNPSTRRTAKPQPAAEPENSGPRLLIETSDGTLVDLYMTSVRRVTVENGQVVVIGKDGKIQRIPLSSVLRMTITP